MNEEILTRLDALAAKLSTTADQLWTVLIRQAQIEGVLFACIALVLAAIAVGFWRIGHPKLMSGWRNGSQYHRDGWEFGLTAGWTISAVCAAVAIVCAFRAALYCLNPSFYALRLILSAAQ